jgi:mycothiol synthase
MTGSAAVPPSATDVRLETSRDLDAELPAMWRVAEAAARGDGELDRPTLEGLTAHYHHLEHCDPTTDFILAWRGSELVAYARVEWNDTTDGERWYDAVCLVDPAVRRQGVGRRLLDWTEARRRELVAADEIRGIALDRPRWFVTDIHDRDVGGDVLLRESGYEPFRRFHSMRRRTLADVPDLPDVALPERLEIRPIRHHRDAIAAVIAADSEAFQDHFGWVDDAGVVVDEILDDPTTDPSLWIVAFDGDKVAGGVLNSIRDDHDGVPVGWLDSIFTRRPWRRRGLARALIARSLVVLHERGVDSAALGVDAENPNQAPQLYASSGFEVASSSTAYRKPVAALMPTDEEVATGR